MLVAASPWALALGMQFAVWVSPVGSKTVALVQGNVDQAQKWLPENRIPIINHYLELTEPHWDAELIVWPEAAITLFEHQAQDVLQALDERGKREHAAVVLGIPSVERVPRDGYLTYNAALAVGDAEGRYTKRQLVPFGEYVPFEDWLRGLIEFFDLPMSSSQPGPLHQPPFRLGDLTSAVAICYEVVYGELMRTSAEDADLLLTISNDTWFGASIGPLQHMQIARMRALENGRALVRSTNNGVTAIVDHKGRLLDALPQFEAGVLRGSFPLLEGRTPYNRYGDFWLVALSLLTLLAAFVRYAYYRFREIERRR
jgi:apolipoprotein N-acyltransferase